MKELDEKDRVIYQHTLRSPNYEKCEPRAGEAKSRR